MNSKTYLKLGDKVKHLKHTYWGVGEVIEERSSSLPGGLCFVRILFEDGVERSFINNFDHEMCCYYTGLRLIEEFNIWET
uniref:DUF3553 domain-containing protein n=1 Tax=Thermodesulfovibrio aggregans TaxID=86166 RepID=A0A7C4AIZ6_9BACT